MSHSWSNFGDLIAEEPSSWAGKSVLSIDVDWVGDTILDDTIDIIEKSGAKACFFVTHDTPLLQRIRANKNFELGIHPNFDSLLHGDASKSAKDIIADLLEIVPEAKVLRSHAMTTSGRWLGLYKDAGITHLSNYILFGQTNIRPVRQINGLTEVPVYFADDGLLYQNSESLTLFDEDVGFHCSANGVTVYNFHPIHVFLNSENLERYAHAKEFQSDLNELLSRRFEGIGARAWLTKLLY